MQCEQSLVFMRKKMVWHWGQTQGRCCHRSHPRLAQVRQESAGKVPESQLDIAKSEHVILSSSEFFTVVISSKILLVCPYSFTGLIFKLNQIFIHTLEIVFSI